MNSGRVIVTYGRSLMSLVIARSLHERGIEVIGCDDVDLTAMSFSRHVSETFTHASVDDGEEAYIDSLVENIKRLKPEDDRPYILIPAFRNTRVIARNHARLAPHITVAAPRKESIGKVFPKDNLVRTAENEGANAPVTVHTKDADELVNKLRAMTPPFLLKPVSGVGGRGIERVEDRDTAIEKHAAFLQENGEAPLIQEVAEGEDYCFAGLFKDGELLAHMAYRNLKSFPVDTGAGAIRETISDDVFLEPVQRLMRATGWSGVAEIDFLWNGDDKSDPVLIEVNPRFWAGLFHSVKSGVDFPWLLYQLFAYGGVKDTGKAKVGETTKAPGLWLASTAQEIAKSDIQFDKLTDAWRSQSNGSWLDKFSAVSSSLGDAVNIDDACFRILESIDLARNSSDEWADQKDPLSGLGILFVLSSLARHGRLPDEVKLN
ncbi:MAG: ATP-grasp domain-containing protein [Pseudomonadota bacterium]